jgi:hypothetical protein
MNKKIRNEIKRSIRRGYVHKHSGNVAGDGKHGGKKNPTYPIRHDHPIGKKNK